MKERILDILDKDGNVKGKESVRSAHINGLLHRSIHILVGR